MKMKQKRSWNPVILALISGIICGLILKFLNITIFNNFFTLIVQIFLKLRNMIVVPLVFFSILSAMSSFASLKTLQRVASKTIALFLLFTLLAILSGIFVAEFFQPGKTHSLSQLPGMEDYKQKQKIEKKSLSDFLLNLIPANPFESLVKGELLAIIFFAMLLGTAIAALKPDNRQWLLPFFESLNLALIKIVKMIMKTAPAGVFALITGAIIQTGFNFLSALLSYTILTIITMLTFLFGIYSLAIKLFTGKSSREFFRHFKPVMLLGFSTSSSNATLPENMLVCEQNLKIDRTVVSFVLPLGATINMSGTAIYQGISAIFIAQIFNLQLTFVQQLTIILTAITAAIGTAGVPGSGIVTLTMVLEAAGIPAAGIGLILGVERVLDMFRTILNVTGDSVTALIVDFQEKKHAHRKMNRKDSNAAE